VQIKIFAISVYTSLFVLTANGFAVGQNAPNPSPVIDSENTVWSTPAPADADSPLLNVLQAISGKPQGLKTTSLLQGVVEVKRTDSGLAFRRCDDQVLEYDSRTTHGAKLFADWEKSADKAGRNVGPEAARSPSI
jgi:hypothetical protein